MRSPLRLLPKEWKTDVVVLRGGGRDRFDKVIPPEEIARKDVLVSPRSTVDPLDFSDLAATTAVLYDEAADGFRYQQTDRIKVPAGARMAGTWKVGGRPSEWPFGSEVMLEQG